MTCFLAKEEVGTMEEIGGVLISPDELNWTQLVLRAYIDQKKWQYLGGWLD